MGQGGGGWSVGCAESHSTFEEWEADNQSHVAPEFKRSPASVLIHVETPPADYRGMKKRRMEGELVTDKGCICTCVWRRNALLGSALYPSNGRIIRVRFLKPRINAVECVLEGRVASSGSESHTQRCTCDERRSSDSFILFFFQS